MGKKKHTLENAIDEAYDVYKKQAEEVVRQLEDSMKEETAAADVYRRRGAYTSASFPQIAELYAHIRAEEEQHFKEFKDAADKLRREA